MFERIFPLKDVKLQLTPDLIQHFENKVQHLLELRSPYNPPHIQARYWEFKEKLENQLTSSYHKYSLKYAIPKIKDKYLSLSPLLRSFMLHVHNKLITKQDNDQERDIDTYDLWETELTDRENKWKRYKELERTIKKQSDVLRNSARSAGPIQRLSPEMISRIHELSTADQRREKLAIIRDYKP